MIYFDMDGTLADLYSVPNFAAWLNAESIFPYKVAKPLINMSLFARLLHKLQSKGEKIGIISYGAIDSTEDFLKETITIKEKWLSIHLPSVIWDEIHIVEYGTPKHSFITEKNSILFDDAKENRDEWTGIAYDEKNIIQILKALI